MIRTRDWRRARTRAVWRKRQGYRNVWSDVVRFRETPRRCSCFRCQMKGRPPMPDPTHADLWRLAADEGADWPSMGNPRAREETDDELGMDDYCRAADIADRGSVVGTGVRLRGADREGRR